MYLVYSYPTPALKTISVTKEATYGLLSQSFLNIGSILDSA